MTHGEAHDLLLELACGDLAPRLARAVEAHAASCDVCAAELGRMRETRRLMAALPQEPAPPGGERILVAAAREAVRARRPRRALPSWFRSAAVAAASLAVVAAVSFRILGTRPRPPAADDPGALMGESRYAQPPPEAPPPADALPPTAVPPAARQSAPPSAPTPPSPRPSPPAARGEREKTARNGPLSPSGGEPARNDPLSPSGGKAARNDPLSPSGGEGQGEGAAERGLKRAAPPEPSRYAQPPPPAAPEPAPDARYGAGRSAEPESYAREEAADARATHDAPPPSAAAPPAAPPAAAPERPRAASRATAREAAPAAERAAGPMRDEPPRPEVRTFPGCEGESRREVELGPGGRVVRYVREGRLAGRRLRVEHVFAADGRLASATARDLETGEPLDPRALGIALPELADDARPDAPPRCGR